MQKTERQKALAQMVKLDEEFGLLDDRTLSNGQDNKDDYLENMFKNIDEETKHLSDWVKRCFECGSQRHD